MREHRRLGRKAAGQAVRVGTLLELAARAGDGRPLFSEPLGAWAMRGGVAIVRALSSHALAVLGPRDRRTELLEYVLRRGVGLPDGSTVRDLFESTKGHTAIDTMEDLTPLVDELVDRRCLRLKDRRTGRPGRPPSPEIEVHPSFRTENRTIRDTALVPSVDAYSANSAIESSADPLDVLEPART